MVDYILLPSYSVSEIKKMEELISRHHSLYLQVFEDKWKPKHHILTHYGGIIVNSGPIRNMSCMRFESKNREVKNYTNVTASRKNITYSIAKKMQ